MFYDSFSMLCKAKNISRTKACVDCGISRTAWRKWENGGVPNGNTLNKFAEYFGVSVDCMLNSEQNNAPVQEDAREIGFDDFTYALNGEVGELTDSDKQLLLSMARQLAEARRKRNRNNDGSETD